MRTTFSGFESTLFRGSISWIVRRWSPPRKRSEFRGFWIYDRVFDDIDYMHSQQHLAFCNKPGGESDLPVWGLVSNGFITIRTRGSVFLKSNSKRYVTCESMPVLSNANEFCHSVLKLLWVDEDNWTSRIDCINSNVMIFSILSIKWAIGSCAIFKQIFA